MVAQPVYCPRFVGRRAQLKTLIERFADASAGRGSLVLVAGEAGSGKSRLVREFCEAPAVAGARSAVGYCYEYAQSPFAPLLVALRSINAEDPAQLSQAPRLRAALVRLLPDIIDGTATAVPEEHADKLRQLDAMCEVLARFGTARTTILIIEDLHWADSATLEFLRHIAPGLPTARVLIIATYRPELLERGHVLRPVLAKLDRNPMVWRIDLEPLGNAEMQALVASALEGRYALPSHVIRAIHLRAEGNPLFAEELLKNAVEDGAGDSASVELPAGVREAVLERLSRMNEADRAVLVRAAAIGRSFRADFLARLLDRRVDDVLAVLKRAIELQLVVELADGDVCYRFRHALTRDAVYEELLAAEARPLHARIAAALESQPGVRATAAELAYHYWQAHDLSNAVRYNEIAGDGAVNVYAHHDAAEFFDRAVRSCEDNLPQRARLLRKLALALHGAGYLDRARRAFESAIEYFQSAGESEDAAQACLSLSRLQWNAGDIAGSKRLIERALDFARADPSGAAPFGALVEMAGTVVWDGNDLNAAAGWFSRAEHCTGRRLMTDEVRLHAYRADLHLWRGDLERAQSDVSRAVEISKQLGDLESEVIFWGNFGDRMTILGERQRCFEAFDMAENALAQADLQGRPGAGMRLQHARARLQYGDLSGARKLLEQALSAPLELPRLRAIAARVGISLGLMLEDDDLARRCSGYDLLDYAFEPGSAVVARVATAFAELFLAGGKKDDARSLLHRALERMKMLPGREDDNWIFVLAARHGDNEDIELARALLTRISERWRTRSSPAYEALVEANAMRRAGNKEAARERGVEAARMFRELGWPYHAAQATEAADERAEALKIYHSFGDLRDARRLEAGLIQVNRRGRPKTALTGREREVAALVAAGKSNRAIADELIIGERTVETHISSIKDKLGVATRAEVAAYVAREAAARQ